MNNSLTDGFEGPVEVIGAASEPVDPASGFEGPVEVTGAPSASGAGGFEGPVEAGTSSTDPAARFSAMMMDTKGAAELQALAKSLGTTIDNPEFQQRVTTPLGFRTYTTFAQLADTGDLSEVNELDKSGKPKGMGLRAAITQFGHAGGAFRRRDTATTSRIAAGQELEVGDTRPLDQQIATGMAGMPAPNMRTFKKIEDMSRAEQDATVPKDVLDIVNQYDDPKAPMDAKSRAKVIADVAKASAMGREQTRQAAALELDIREKLTGKSDGFTASLGNLWAKGMPTVGLGNTFSVDAGTGIFAALVSGMDTTSDLLSADIDSETGEVLRKGTDYDTARIRGYGYGGYETITEKYFGHALGKMLKGIDKVLFKGSAKKLASKSLDLLATQMSKSSIGKGLVAFAKGAQRISDLRAWDNPSIEWGEEGIQQWAKKVFAQRPSDTETPVYAKKVFNEATGKIEQVPIEPGSEEEDTAKRQIARYGDKSEYVQAGMRQQTVGEKTQEFNDKFFTWDNTVAIAEGFALQYALTLGGGALHAAKTKEGRVLIDRALLAAGSSNADLVRMSDAQKSEAFDAYYGSEANQKEFAEVFKDAGQQLSDMAQRVQESQVWAKTGSALKPNFDSKLATELGDNKLSTEGTATVDNEASGLSVDRVGDNFTVRDRDGVLNPVTVNSVDEAQKAAERMSQLKQGRQADMNNRAQIAQRVAQTFAPGRKVVMVQTEADMRRAVEAEYAAEGSNFAEAQYKPGAKGITTPDGAIILNVAAATGVQDMVSTITHETGHSAFTESGLTQLMAGKGIEQLAEELQGAKVLPSGKAAKLDFVAAVNALKDAYKAAGVNLSEAAAVEETLARMNEGMQAVMRKRFGDGLVSLWRKVRGTDGKATSINDARRIVAGILHSSRSADVQMFGGPNAWTAQPEALTGDPLAGLGTEKPAEAAEAPAAATPAPIAPAAAQAQAEAPALEAPPVETPAAQEAPAAPKEPKVFASEDEFIAYADQHESEVQSWTQGVDFLITPSEAGKEASNAVQEPGAAQVDVRNAPGNGEAVGGGNAPQLEAPREGRREAPPAVQAEAPKPKGDLALEGGTAADIEADKAKTEAQRKKREEREKIAELAAKPLTGTLGDTTPPLPGMEAAAPDDLELLNRPAAKPKAEPETPGFEIEGVKFGGVQRLPGMPAQNVWKDEKTGETFFQPATATKADVEAHVAARRQKAVAMPKAQQAPSRIAPKNADVTFYRRATREEYAEIPGLTVNGKRVFLTQNRGDYRNFRLADQHEGKVMNGMAVLLRTKGKSHIVNAVRIIGGGVMPDGSETWSVKDWEQYNRGIAAHVSLDPVAPYQPAVMDRAAGPVSYSLEQGPVNALTKETINAENNYALAGKAFGSVIRPGQLQAAAAFDGWRDPETGEGFSDSAVEAFTGYNRQSNALNPMRVLAPAGLPASQDAVLREVKLPGSDGAALVYRDDLGRTSVVTSTKFMEGSRGSFTGHRAMLASHESGKMINIRNTSRGDHYFHGLAELGSSRRSQQNAALALLQNRGYFSGFDPMYDGSIPKVNGIVGFSMQWPSYLGNGTALQDATAFANALESTLTPAEKTILRVQRPEDMSIGNNVSIIFATDIQELTEKDVAGARPYADLLAEFSKLAMDTVSTKYADNLINGVVIQSIEDPDGMVGDTWRGIDISLGPTSAEAADMFAETVDFLRGLYPNPDLGLRILGALQDRLPDLANVFARGQLSMSIDTEESWKKGAPANAAAYIEWAGYGAKIHVNPATEPGLPRLKSALHELGHFFEARYLRRWQAVVRATTDNYSRWGTYAEAAVEKGADRAAVFVKESYKRSLYKSEYFAEAFARWFIGETKLVNILDNASGLPDVSSDTISLLGETIASAVADIAVSPIRDYEKERTKYEDPDATTLPESVSSVAGYEDRGLAVSNARRLSYSLEQGAPAAGLLVNERAANAAKPTETRPAQATPETEISKAQAAPVEVKPKRKFASEAEYEEFVVTNPDKLEELARDGYEIDAATPEAEAPAEKAAPAVEEPKEEFVPPLRGMTEAPQIYARRVERARQAWEESQKRNGYNPGAESLPELLVLNNENVEKARSEASENAAALSEDAQADREKESDQAPRYRISREEDAEYLAAVQRGDTETAQRMADEAAKKLGYKITAYNGYSGAPGYVYGPRHGVRAEGGRFGFFFTPFKTVAESYGEYFRDPDTLKPSFRVRNVYIKMAHPLVLPKEYTSWNEFAADLNRHGITLPEHTNGSNTLSPDTLAETWMMFLEWASGNTPEILKKTFLTAGYDGLIINDTTARKRNFVPGKSWQGTTFIALLPEAIKSAEAVTYDDAGNVIPLSQRFNAESNDIRYRLDRDIEIGLVTPQTDTKIPDAFLPIYRKAWDKAFKGLVFNPTQLAESIIALPPDTAAAYVKVADAIAAHLLAQPDAKFSTLPGYVSMGIPIREAFRAQWDAARPTTVELEEGKAQVPYSTMSGVEVVSPMMVPRDLGLAVATANGNFLDRHPEGVDAYVAAKMGWTEAQVRDGRLDGAQLDTLALAIEKVDAGSGFIVGTMTGGGKGRVMAAVMAYHLKNGRMPVFLTAKANLFTAMWEDIQAIGEAELFKPLVLNDYKAPGVDNLSPDAEDENGFLMPQFFAPVQRNAAVSDRKMPKGATALFLTYSQVQTNNRNKIRLIERVLAAGGGLVMDEAHLAAGADSNTGAVLRQLSAIPKAGVVFSSATFAKRGENMTLYKRAGYSQFFEDDDQMNEVLAVGGVPFQQFLAARLTEQGYYIRHELDYTGINFKKIETTDTLKTPEERTVLANREEEVADRYNQVVRTVMRFLGAVKTVNSKLPPGKPKAEMAGKAFLSSLHNTASFIYTALKAETVANAAVASLREGRAPVITLYNTNQALLEEIGEGNTADVGRYLMRLAERATALQMPDGTTASIMTPEGYGYLTTLMRAADADVLVRSAQGLMEEAELASRYLKEQNIPASPIDRVKEIVEAAGFKFAELTGRTLMVDKYGTIVRRVKPRADDVVRDFNNSITPDGKPDTAALLNSAGATGLSIHASPKFKNTARREMFVLQPAWDINEMMQMFGRVNRKDQLSKPIYRLMFTSAAGEQRNAAILMQKLRSLSANTSGVSKAGYGESAEDALDFMNSFGDKALRELEKEQNNVVALINDLRQSDTIRRATSISQFLPVRDQAEFIAQVQARVAALQEHARESGAHDLEAGDIGRVPLSEEQLSTASAMRAYEVPVVGRAKIMTAGDAMAQAREWQQEHGDMLPAARERIDKAKQATQNPWLHRVYSQAEQLLEHTMDSIGRVYRAEDKLTGERTWFIPLEMRLIPSGTAQTASDWRVRVSFNNIRGVSTLPLTVFTKLLGNAYGSYDYVYNDNLTRKEDRTLITGDIAKALVGSIDAAGLGGGAPRIVRATSEKGNFPSFVLMMPRGVTVSNAKRIVSSKQVPLTDVRDIQITSVHTRVDIDAGRIIVYPTHSRGQITGAMFGFRNTVPQKSKTKDVPVAAILRASKLPLLGTRADSNGYVMSAAVGIEEANRILADLAAFNPGLQAMRVVSDEKSVGGQETPEPAAPRYRLTDQTETPAFKAWFGDSKVVDSNGKPVIVYHGTGEDFVIFDRDKLGENTSHPTAKFGFFFTDSAKIAASFSREGYIKRANIMPVFLSIKNPLVLTWEDWIKSANWTNRETAAHAFNETTRKVAEGAHDGIFLPAQPDRAPEYRGNTWIAFNPTQIKSATANVGAFNPHSSDIRYRLSTPVQVGELRSQSELERLSPVPFPILDHMRGGGKLVIPYIFRGGLYDWFTEMGGMSAFNLAEREAFFRRPGAEDKRTKGNIDTLAAELGYDDPQEFADDFLAEWRRSRELYEDEKRRQATRRAALEEGRKVFNGVKDKAILPEVMGRAVERVSQTLPDDIKADIARVDREEGEDGVRHFILSRYFDRVLLEMGETYSYEGRDDTPPSILDDQGTFARPETVDGKTGRQAPTFQQTKDRLQTIAAILYARNPQGVATVTDEDAAAWVRDLVENEGDLVARGMAREMVAERIGGVRQTPLTKYETALMLWYQTDLDRRANTLTAANNIEGLKSLDAEHELVMKETVEYLEAARRYGSAAGQALQALKLRVDKGFNIVRIYREAVKNNGDIALTPEQFAKLAERVARLEAAWSAFVDASAMPDNAEELQARITALEAEIAAMSGAGTGLTADLKALEAKRAGLEEQRNNLSATVGEMSERRAKLVEEITRLETEINFRSALAQEIDALQTKLDGLNEKLLALEAEYAGLDTSRLAALNAEIAAIETEYATKKGEYEKANADLKAAESRLKRMRKLMDALSGKTRSKIERRRAVLNDASNLYGVFKAEMEKAQLEQMADRWRGANPLSKLLIGASMARNIIRALQSMGDESVAGRQLVKLGLGHPLLWARAFAQSQRLMFSLVGPTDANGRLLTLAERSDRAMFEIDQMLREHPLWGVLRKAGLDWMDLTADPSSFDEQQVPVSAFLRAYLPKSRLVDGVTTVLDISNNHYAGMSNMLRFYVAAQLYETMQKANGGKPPSEEDARAIVTTVDIFGGRGDITNAKVRSFVHLSNNILYSPRLAAANVQFYFRALGTVANPSYSLAARKMIVTEYLRTLGMYAVLSAVARLISMAFSDDDNEQRFQTNLGHPVFGQFLFGQNRFDFTGGAALWARYFGSTFGLSDKVSTETGLMTGERQKFDPMPLWRLFRSKLEPIAGLTLDLATGETYDRQAAGWRATPDQPGYNRRYLNPVGDILPVPLSAQSFYDLVRGDPEQGVEPLRNPMILFPVMATEMLGIKSSNLPVNSELAQEVEEGMTGRAERLEKLRRKQQKILRDKDMSPELKEIKAGNLQSQIDLIRGF